MIRLRPNTNEPVEVPCSHSIRPSSTPSGVYSRYLSRTRWVRPPLRMPPARISERDCFEAVHVPPGHRVQLGRGRRLGKGSGPALQRPTRRGVAAGPFAHLVEEAISALDKVIGLDFSDVSIEGSSSGPGGRRRNRTEPDRPRQDRVEIASLTPTACPSAGSSTAEPETTRSCWLPPSTTSRGEQLLADVETIALDRGYDSCPPAPAWSRRGIQTPSSPRSA